MLFQVGQKVKVVKTDGKAGYKRIGVISLISKHYIQVQFENYRECYNKVDIITEGGIDLFIRKDKKWIKVVRRVRE